MYSSLSQVLAAAAVVAFALSIVTVVPLAVGWLFLGGAGTLLLVDVYEGWKDDAS